MNLTTAPRLEFHEREDCWICGNATNPGSWIKRGTHIQRNVEIISLVQTCRVCEQIEEAMIEAEIESRRYTEIELEDRCICGRAIHSLLGSCVTCWRERRMIDKKLRELKLTRDIMRQLRRSAREKLKATVAAPRGDV